MEVRKREKKNTIYSIENWKFKVNGKTKWHIDDFVANLIAYSIITAGIVVFIAICGLAESI